jgi:hypothetical protein
LQFNDGFLTSESVEDLSIEKAVRQGRRATRMRSNGVLPAAIAYEEVGIAPR